MNPAVLLREMEDIRKRGVDVSRLYISDRTNLIMPYHILLDGLDEESLGGNAIGTTRKGVGPCFTDKIARLGIRAGDLLDKKAFHERLHLILERKNKLLSKVYNVDPLSLDEVFNQYCEYGEKLAPHIRETTAIIDEAIRSNQPVMLEGAQGVLLDPDFGTYPYCTSSSPMAGGPARGPALVRRMLTKSWLSLKPTAPGWEKAPCLRS